MLSSFTLKGCKGLKSLPFSLGKLESLDPTRFIYKLFRQNYNNIYLIKYFIYSFDKLIQTFYEYSKGLPEISAMKKNYMEIFSRYKDELQLAVPTLVLVNHLEWMCASESPLRIISKSKHNIENYIKYNLIHNKERIANDIVTLCININKLATLKHSESEELTKLV